MFLFKLYLTLYWATLVTKRSMVPLHMFYFAPKVIQLKIRLHIFNTRPRLWSYLFLLLLLSIPPNFSPTDEKGFRELGQWLDLPAHVEQADALVIMGGRDRQRLKPGMDLFQHGLAPQLWYTGSKDSARVATNLAAKRGIPTEAFTNLVGTSTWEEAERIAFTMQERDLHSVIIVTSWYHGRRTLCMLRHHLEAQQTRDNDVQIYYQPVGYENYGPDSWWRSENGREVVFSEIAKFGYYWLVHGLMLQGC
jgi:uncharacterized SAM-binding protein YcdF (DUF218 family)